MADLRMKTDTIEVAGKTYTISCNLGVFADVQEQYGGNLLAALEDARKKPLRVALIWAAAMVNDAADAAGGEERYTAAELGRLLPCAMPGRFTERIMSLVWAALEPAAEDGDAAAESGEETPAQKN